ncbi:hypothetical protein Tco_1232018 [Tanacetum coccineum]
MGCGLSKLLLLLKVVAHDDDVDDGTNHNFPLSVHKVLSNDDLLMEILLRLPILSLHLFKPNSQQKWSKHLDINSKAEMAVKQLVASCIIHVPLLAVQVERKCFEYIASFAHA